MKPISCIAFALLLLVPVSAGAQDAAKAAAEKAAAAQSSQEELEQQFSEKMTGATLLGQFTVSDMNDGKPLAQDRYALGAVTKLPNGLWQFEAHIQYGDKDVKIPLALPVKWAGDTPVITVTNIAFPGLGTYSARVLFYGDSYAGTWSGKTHGGEMWGKIIPKGQEAPELKPADDKDSEKKDAAPKDSESKAAATK
jgi:hypothetical protein